MGFNNQDNIRIAKTVKAVETFLIPGESEYSGRPRSRVYCFARIPGGGILKGADPESAEGWRRFKDCDGVEFRGDWENTGETFRVYNSTTGDVPGGVVVEIALWGDNDNEDGIIPAFITAIYCEES